MPADPAAKNKDRQMPSVSPATIATIAAVLAMPTIAYAQSAERRDTAPPPAANAETKSYLSEDEIQEYLKAGLEKINDPDEFARHIIAGFEKISPTFREYHQFEKLFLDTVKTFLSENGYDSEKHIRNSSFDEAIFQKLEVAINALSDAHAQLQSETRKTVPDLPFIQLRNLLDQATNPYIIFRITLNIPTETPLMVMALNDFDPPTSIHDITTPERLGVACAINDPPRYNQAATLLLDDATTREANEGVSELATYLQEEYLPQHPQLLSDLHITDLRCLTPKQAVLLACNITTEALDYSNLQIQSSGEARHEAEINDHASITDLLKGGKHSKENAVCRNYASFNRGIFDALKILQRQDTSRINTVFLLERSGMLDSPGSVPGHAWNQVFCFTEAGIIALVIDPTWADASSQADPARAGIMMDRQLDYTRKRFLPMIDGFYDTGLLLSSHYAHGLLEHTAAGVMDSEQQQNTWKRLLILYSRLTPDDQRLVFNTYNLKNLIFPSITFPPVEESITSSFYLRYSTDIDDKKVAALTKKLEKLEAEKPELFRGELVIIQPVTTNENDFLCDERSLLIGVELNEAELIERLEQFQEVRRTIEETKSHSVASIRIRMGLPSQCPYKQASLAVTNMKNYFTDNARRDLLLHRKFEITEPTDPITESDRITVNDYYSVGIPISLFDEDYDADQIDDMLITALSAANDTTVRATRHQKAQRLIAIQALEQSPGIGSVYVDEGLQYNAELANAVMAGISKLSAADLEFLSRNSPSFRFASSSTFFNLPDEYAFLPFYFLQATSIKERVTGCTLLEEGKLDRSLTVQRYFPIADYFQPSAVNHIQIKRGTGLYPLAVNPATGTLCVQVDDSYEVYLKLDDQIIPQENPVMEIGGRLRAPLDSRMAAPSLLDSDIILFAHDSKINPETLEQTVSRYIEVQKLREQVEALGIKLEYTSLEEDFFTAKDLSALTQLVALLSERKECLVNYQNVKLKINAQIDRFRLDVGLGTITSIYTAQVDRLRLDVGLDTITSRYSVESELSQLLPTLDAVDLLFAEFKRIEDDFCVTLSCDSHFGNEINLFLPKLSQFLTDADGKYNGYTIKFDNYASYQATKPYSGATIQSVESGKKPSDEISEAGAEAESDQPTFYHFCIYPAEMKIEVNIIPREK